MYKNIKTILVLSLLMALCLAIFPAYAVQANNGLHIISAYYSDKSQSTLVVEGVFYNVSNTVISNFRNVKVTIYDANNIHVTTSFFDDEKLANLKLGPGGTAKWTFNILYPTKGADLSRFTWETSFTTDTQAGNIKEAGIKVFYNNEKINFKDTKPVIKNGYTLVPVRGVFEKMGAQVKWDQASKTVTVTAGNQNIKLIVNSKKAYINGKAVNLDAPVQFINNRTLIPLRFITEAIGGSIFWGGTEADGYIAIRR